MLLLILTDYYIVIKSLVNYTKTIKTFLPLK